MRGWTCGSTTDDSARKVATLARRCVHGGAGAARALGMAGSQPRRRPRTGTLSAAEYRHGRAVDAVADPEPDATHQAHPLEGLYADPAAAWPLDAGLRQPAPALLRAVHPGARPGHAG